MYQVARTYLLPAPYDTDCVDYAPLGFANRRHCYAQCLLRKVRPKWPQEVPIAVQLLADDRTHLASGLNLSLRLQCELRCQKRDCVEIAYRSEMTRPI